MRKVEERWQINRMNVVKETLPLADAQGRAIHWPNGDPKMENYTSLVFVMVDPGCHRTVLIPLTDEGKQKLVEMLTGGIVVPGV
jgi:hypothetical protein